MAETNKYNFLRWSNSNAESLVNFTQLPEPNIKCTQPILVAGETTAFYWNHESNTAYSGNISLCNLSGTVISANIGTMTAFTHLTGTHATGTLICPSVPQGFYKLSLSGGGTIFSNIVEVLSDADLIAETGVFEFWDTKQIRQFKYPYLTNFKQKFRLRYDRGNGQYFREQEVQKYTNGTYKSISESSYKYFKVKILEADESMSDAIDAMLSHSYLKINGILFDFRNDSGVTVSRENEVLGPFEFEVMYNYNKVTC